MNDLYWYGLHRSIPSKDTGFEEIAPAWLIFVLISCELYSSIHTGILLSGLPGSDPTTAYYRVACNILNLGILLLSLLAAPGKPISRKPNAAKLINV